MPSANDARAAAAFSLARAVPAAQQQVDFLVASDNGGATGGKQSIEAVADATVAVNAPGTHGFGVALQRQLSKILTMEQTADLHARGVGDDNGLRLGQRLQPGGQIWSFPQHGLLADGFGSVDVADHDQARGNPDAHAHLLFARLQPSDGMDDLEARTRCAFGIILAGLRPAEIYQHPVAHAACNIAAETAHGSSDRVLVGSDDLQQDFELQSRGKDGRIDEVAEHHGELAALGAPFWTCARRHQGMVSCLQLRTTSLTECRAGWADARTGRAGSLRGGAAGATEFRILWKRHLTTRAHHLTPSATTVVAVQTIKGWLQCRCHGH